MTDSVSPREFQPLSGAAIDSLRTRVGGRVLTPEDPDYFSECAGFNTAVVHTPELVVAVRSAADALECIRFAREHGLPVHIQGAGHGAYGSIHSGLLVSTRSLDSVRIDPEAGIATIGGGARWGAVVAAAAEHGLAPITGSALTVGVVGYLLGGGLGPLARSHGFSSDYALGFSVVTGNGVTLEVSADNETDLFWALRGGKKGLGIVIELRLRLVPLRTLYAGALYFDELEMESAFRTWVGWTAVASSLVTTSVAFVRYPAADAVPPPLRGRRILVLHFAYPGDKQEGERLAAPLRSAAPIHVDALAEMPASDVARIHNDPTQPLAASTRAGMLTHIDQDFASVMLSHFGPGTNSAFLAAELRHLGEATRRDVPGGSAVGGRESSFTLGGVCVDPTLFETAFPAAYDRLISDLAPWLSTHNNINFLAPVRSAAHLATAWSPATFSRLARIRQEHDPDGLFSFGFREALRSGDS